ncbi:MAG: Hint domain-containing protein [Pseudomonadota bacterium]
MARISELHYSNVFASTSGIPEFIEISLTAAEQANAGDFHVVMYTENPATGQWDVITLGGTGNTSIPLDDYSTATASSPTTDPETGNSVHVIYGIDNGFLLTDPNTVPGTTNAHAFALVHTPPGGPVEVIDFYDIGGGAAELTASNGLAAGATSTNLTVTTPPEDATYSIQFNEPNPETPVLAGLSPGDGGFCFTPGTQIATHNGPVDVENLEVGDYVKTKLNGFQPIRWIGSRRVNAVGKLAPIVISAGVFKNDKDLMVSPEHRILISDWRAKLFFAQKSVLAAAKILVNNDTIYQRDVGWIDYYHIGCDQHEILYANQVEAESFLPTPYSLSLLTPDAREEFLAIFPEFDSPDSPLQTPQFQVIKYSERDIFK